MDQEAQILSLLGQVNTQLAALQAEHGTKLDNIAKRMDASNGTVAHCAELLGEHETRVSLLERIQATILENWEKQQALEQEYQDRVTRLEKHLIALTICSPVFALIGGGVVKIAELRGWL